MSVYTPDRWVIVRITQENDEVIHKVLAGWSGGYLDGDSWQLNSGIKEVRDLGNEYQFIGYSGSIYRCHKSGEGMNIIMMSALGRFQDMAKEAGKRDDRLTVIPVEEYLGDS